MPRLGPRPGRTRDIDQMRATIRDIQQEMLRIKKVLEGVHRTIEIMQKTIKQQNNNYQNAMALMGAIINVLRAIDPDNESLANAGMIVTSAGSFAAAGSVFGPIGTAIGWIAGAVYGALEAIFG